jgi:2-methylcitrate dehydratase PrpD
MQDPVIDKILAHVERVGAHGVTADVRAAAGRLIVDTLAVSVAGLVAPWRDEVLDMLLALNGGAEATVFGSGERLPLVHAAMLNAYQIHCQEFDCLHEKAVVHPMATALPTLLGWSEREGGVTGAQLIRAIVVAVDIAVTLGLCSRAPMRFFRPANAGGFGATVGLAMLAGLSADQLRVAIGIYYGQCAGTMQAHEEGSPQLAMQMGFAARSAVTAVELAAACRDPAHRSAASSVTSRCLTAAPIRPRLTRSAVPGASLRSVKSRFHRAGRPMAVSTQCRD